jgi:hypothetical protein
MKNFLAGVALVVGAFSLWAQSPEAALIGEWGKSRVSTLDFVNPGTGAHADPSGERLNVRFFPDGTYKLGWLRQSSLYSCSSRVFGYKVGAYQVSGSQITMQDRSSTLTSRDTCHPEWNYEKHPPLARSVYQWRLERTRFGLALVMRGTDGKETVYLRETGRPLLN